MATPPALIVRLIGIGKYENYPSLCAEGDTNAEDLHNFLNKEYKDGRNCNIKTVKDATKEVILDELRSLRYPVDRTKGIVIFFSGYGGSTGQGTSIICPTDIGRAEKSKGITDKELSQLFDSIAKFRGKNITFFLDSPSLAFDWGWPSSFVVVAPQEVPSNRKAFTTAIIDALRSEKGSMSTLTVRSFAAKIHSFMPNGIEIDCHGQNSDRLLFNPAGGRAHHAFIAGRVEESQQNDSIGVTIFAGAAHGVENGTTFNVYSNHVDTSQKPIGHLEVTDRYHAVINSTTTNLALPLDTVLPVVFYVVETGSLSRALNVFADGVDTSKVNGLMLNVVEESKADIILRCASDKVEILWNTFPKDILPGSARKFNHNVTVSDNAADLAKELSNAAWFTHRVNYVDNSIASSAFFEAEFKAVDENQEPTGKNLLLNGTVSLDITQDNNRTTYCLVLSNKTDHEIWPYVFICNPSDFSIRPWYTATNALSPKSLGTTNTVEIGCGDEDDLAFEWTAELGVDVAYINIFATKERTNFSCLTQSETTTVERLREVAHNQSISVQGNEAPRKHRAMSIKKDWEAMQIAITRKYVQRTSRTISPSASRKAFLRKLGARIRTRVNDDRGNDTP